MTRPVVHGLYAVTRPSPHLDADVEAALAGGARCVQYRDKHATAGERLARARALVAVCARHDAHLIINDDPQLAAAVGASGVHLGRDDGSVATARAVLGRDAIIGVSCYDAFARAEHAVRAGADYVAFGSFFPSSTKPDAVRAPLALLQQARTLSVPVVAIGGITPDNGAALIAAGAQALAVIEGVFGQSDIKAAAAAYAALFS